MLIIEARRIAGFSRCSIVCLPLHGHADLECSINGQAQKFLTMLQTSEDGALQALHLIGHLDILHKWRPMTCMGRVQVPKHVASFQSPQMYTRPNALDLRIKHHSNGSKAWLIQENI